MGPKHQKARAANLEKVWYSLTINYLCLNNSYDMKKSLILALLVLGALSLKAQAVIGPEHQERAAALVQQMTLDEKISLIAGYQDGFHTAPVERLGIPEIRMADGPQGVRNNTKSTLFACGVAAAASWNPSLVREMGVALGQDSRARGVHILLGPGVNICRSPLCGRNFEYFGEDPFLAAETAVAYIEGVQSQGVMATVKHFALNNQEYNRHHVNSVADERTINEIYFPAFRAAVERAHVGSVMTSYNPVNGVHSAENAYLIGQTLRGKWNFQGFTMSDWTSTYTPLLMVQDGVDLEMPRAFCYTAETLKPLLERGVITEKQIDDKVCRILQTYIAFGFLDRPQLDSSIPEDNPYSREVAYRLACESIVLLKNDGILPLKKNRRIALSGPGAEVIPCGGGSGAVDPLYTVSLKEGLQLLGARFSEKADVEIVALGFDKTTEKENHDRTFALPEGQETFVEEALARGRKVILIVNAGGAVDLSRIEGRVSAILWAWYPGQEGGKALAEILYGKVNPSGRLPVSFPRALEDNPAQPYYAPSEPYNKRGHTVVPTTYAEGIFTGYRGYGETAPLYPFGFGLCYTDFSYSELTVTPAGDGFDVRLEVRNSGNRDGSETVQIYVHEENPCVPRPVRELKGFCKVSIPKGQARTVTVHLPREAFAYYDSDSHGWVVNPGAFTIEAGASAADIRTAIPVVLE
jgi:beta-glucosidase